MFYIVEGVESVWHYHLSKTFGGETICGKKKGSIMFTEIPISCWMMKHEPGNTPMSFCAKCEKIRKEIANE